MARHKSVVLIILLYIFLLPIQIHSYFLVMDESSEEDSLAGRISIDLLPLK